MSRWWVVLATFAPLSCSAADDGGPVASGGTSGSGALGGSDGGTWPNTDGAGGAGGTAGTAGTGGTGGASGGIGGSGAAADASADADAAPAIASCTATGAVDCSAATPPSYACGDPSPSFVGSVNAALELVLAQHPEWFDTAQGPAPCCPLALQPQLFVEAVVAAVNAAGMCAMIDPNNPSIEIVVKHDNACSEQYVLLTSANIVRHPPKFQGTCAPAWL